jgi:hypothetical protein
MDWNWYNSTRYMHDYGVLKNMGAQRVLNEMRKELVCINMLNCIMRSWDSRLKSEQFVCSW